MKEKTKRFRVALSFPGEKREYVESVAKLLAKRLGSEEKILYDRFHTAEFARKRLGFYLPKLYRDESDLIVVILCADYEKKTWCGLEWQAIFDLIAERQDDALMLFRADEAEISGVYITDGYVPVDAFTPAQAVTLILQRLAINEGLRRDHYLEAEDSSASSTEDPRPVSPKPAAKPAIQWPSIADDYKWPLADRKEEFAFFQRMISGQTKQRLMLIDGDTNTGKTVCLTEFRTYARYVGMRETLLDFKGCPALDSLFEVLKFDLQREILRESYDCKDATWLYKIISDLQRLDAPLLLIFDTYQHASDSTRNWIENTLLPRMERAPAVVVVIAGQDVPDLKKYPWGALAISYHLSRIEKVDEWRPLFGEEGQANCLQDQHIEMVLHITKGEPGQTYAILESFRKKRQKIGDRPEPDRK